MADQYEEIEEIDKRPFNYAYFKRMLTYARPYRRQLALAVVVIIIGSLLRLTEPYLLRTAIDEGITPRNLAVVNRIALLWLIFQFVGALSDYARIQILNRTGQGILYDLRQEIFVHIQWLSLRFYDGRPVGRIMARITNDVETINSFINAGLVTIVSQTVSLVGIIVVMFALNTRLAIMAFIVVPGMVWIVARLRPAMETAWRNVRKANSNINANLNESMSGIRVTQAFHREAANIERFDKLNDTYYDTFMRAINIEILIWPLVDIFGMVGTCLVLWAGANMVLRGELTVGYVMAFTDYLFRFWEPINAISRVYSRVLSAMASAERIFEYLDTQPEIVDAENAKPIRSIEGDVSLESNVQASAAKAERRGMFSGVTTSFLSDSTMKTMTSGRSSAGATATPAPRSSAERGRCGETRKDASSASGRTMEKASGTLRISRSQSHPLRTLPETASRTATAAIERRSPWSAVRRSTTSPARAEIRPVRFDRYTERPTAAPVATTAAATAHGESPTASMDWPRPRAPPERRMLAPVRRW